jgi:hypothetical protein
LLHSSEIQKHGLKHGQNPNFRCPFCLAEATRFRPEKHQNCLTLIKLIKLTSWALKDGDKSEAKGEANDNKICLRLGEHFSVLVSGFLKEIVREIMIENDK